MKGYKKWIFLYLVIASFLIASIQPKPLAAIAKRAEETEDLNELHHATVSRTETTSTTTTTTITTTNTKRHGTSTGTATATPTTGTGGGNSGNSNSPPVVIPTHTDAWWIAVYGTLSGISPQMASLGAILIVLGLFLCSLGFRLAKVMLAIMGLLTLGSMTWIALANLQPEGGYSRDAITMIVVPVGVGVVGAIAYYLLWNIALYLAAAFGGFIFAVFICSWKSDLVILNLIGRSCFLGGMGLLFAVLVYFFERFIMLFVTSFVGAYIVFFGIDCLARVGFIAGPMKLLDRNPRHLVEYEVSKFVYVLLAMILVMFILSFIWQFLINAAIEFGLHAAAIVKGKKDHEEFHKHEEENHIGDRSVHEGHSIAPADEHASMHTSAGDHAPAPAPAPAAAPSGSNNAPS